MRSTTRTGSASSRFLSWVGLRLWSKRMTEAPDGFGHGRKLLHLALPDKCRGICLGPALEDFRRYLRAGASDQFTEFIKSGI